MHSTNLRSGEKQTRKARSSWLINGTREPRFRVADWYLILDVKLHKFGRHCLRLVEWHGVDGVMNATFEPAIRKCISELGACYLDTLIR